MNSGRPYSDSFTFLEGMERYWATIGSNRAYLLKNVDFFRSLATVRDGIIAIWWSTAGAQIYGMGIIKKETGDILCRIAGNKFQRLVSNTWTDVTTLSGSYPASMESFSWPDNTGAAFTSGTITAANTRSISATGYTNYAQLVGKYIVITSWPAIWDTKLVASATASEIFIEGTFNVLPTGTDTFQIRNRADHVYVTNGVDPFMMYDGTNVTTFPNSKRFHYLAANNNRLYGARNDEDILTFSDLGTGYFSTENTIPIDQDGDQITGMVSNQDRLVVYKQYSRFLLTGWTPELFNLRRMESNKGSIAPLSIVNGNNLQFFLSDEGIEMFNFLEQSSLDEALPISLIIGDMISAHSTAEKKAAISWVDDNKLHLQIWSTVYVYHIAHSDIMRSQVFSVYEYPGTVQYATRLQGKAYIAINGVTYTIGGTTDNGVPIEVEMITNRRTQSGKEDYRQNKLYLRTYFEFERPSVNTDVTFSMAHNGSALVVKKVVNIRDKWNTTKVDYSHRATDIQAGFSFSTSEKIRFIHGSVEYNVAPHL